MKSIRLVVLVLGVVAAAMAAAPSAGASGAQTPTTRDDDVAGVDGDRRNFAFTGATITSPADPTPRSLNGYQAAVFVQSWLPEAMYGKPELRDPPADLPVYRVDLMGSWGGDATAGRQPDRVLRVRRHAPRSSPIPKVRR